MDRISKPVVGKYGVELPKPEVELPESGAKPIYTDVILPYPPRDQGPASPPASAAGFYAFGARRYAEPDLNMWRSVGPGWAIAWAIASVFAALLLINLLASVAL
jgi:hypothetical protein